MIQPRFVLDFTRWAALVLVLVLGGCMLTGPTSSVSIVAPQVEMTVDPDWPEVNWSVQVQRPQTDQMRDSDRMLVRVSRSRLQPFPAAAWLDSMPGMFQALMIRKLEDAGRFSGVGRTGGMRSRFSLVTEIRHFEAVDDGQSGLGVHLAMQANLIHQSSGRVVATRTFDEQARAPGKDLDQLVETFERAMGALLADLTGWLLSEGEAASLESEQWRDRSREQGWRSRRN